MSQHPTHNPTAGIPAIGAITTVPGTYFMPLVEAGIEFVTWATRKISALVRR